MRRSCCLEGGHFEMHSEVSLVNVERGMRPETGLKYHSVNKHVHLILLQANHQHINTWNFSINMIIPRRYRFSNLFFVCVCVNMDMLQLCDMFIRRSKHGHYITPIQSTNDFVGARSSLWKMSAGVTEKTQLSPATTERSDLGIYAALDVTRNYIVSNSS